MTSGTDDYLAVLKASYDYDPQSEDEIPVKENQILFLLERVDDDWWKVKVKTDSLEEEGSSGLVPAAWLEPAEPSSMVKALYDYSGNAAGELSISEDEILMAFDSEDDWLLVQSTKDGGKAGYVPANYVGSHSVEDEGEEPNPAPEIVVPSSPPRPASTYVDPADRVAASKANADDIKTWSVSEVDKKGKKMKGTLGIGNGAVFFASETSKAAVQKWQTSEITDISIEKGKHVHIEVGGANSASLHFHVGAKDNAEAIVSKLETSKALSGASNTQGPSTRAVPPVAVEIKKKPSVHFSPASPVIIPSRDEEPEDEPEEDEELDTYDAADGEQAIVLYDFTADQDDEMSVTAGDALIVLEKDEEWWKCRNSEGHEGVVPASYIELRNGDIQSTAPHDEDEDEDEAQRQAEDEAQRQAEAAAKEEEAAVAAAEKEAERRAKQRAEEARRQKERKVEEAKRQREQREKEKAEAEAAKEKERRKEEAEQRAKTAAAAEEERKKRKEAAAMRKQASPSPPTAPEIKRSSEAGSPSSTRLPEGGHRVRVWHDRTGQFRADAVFLGLTNGKIRLHKTNGVIVEVPVEKISADDMRYVEKITNRKSRSAAPRQTSEDDVPLAVQKRQSQAPPKKSPEIDWFDFFLSAGCDMHDCTRYAAAFERDKIDVSILGDITESTMRSLGLREGDIIRVTKVIAQRNPKANTKSAGDQKADEPTRSPPSLFTNPGGELKQNIRRGRPTPSSSKSLPNAVDLNAIGSVSDQIQRTSSPQSQASPVTNGVQPPPRSSSAVPATGGFDDDAWTPRTKPLSPQPAPPRAPSAPPTAAVPTKIDSTTITSVAPTPAQNATATSSAAAPTLPPVPVQSNTLAKTTESDIFDQLARLSELRKTTPAGPSPPVAATPPNVNVSPPIVSAPPPNSTPPVSYQMGLGMGSSPSPMGQLQIQSNTPPQQSYNAPRGPYAPVPVNQSLLQPLIPTQTGFNSFIPTRPMNTVSPSLQTSPQPSFLATQPTGFPNQPMMSQPTGMPFNAMNGFQSSSPFGNVATNPTGFNPNMGQSFAPPPVPPLPSSNANNTSPANVFAQMKSGTFAQDQDSQNADKYDPFRPNPMIAQATGWGGYQGSFY